MRVSFFSLNLSPLPSALYHQEVPSLSGVQAVDLSCETSPPSPTSTPQSRPLYPDRSTAPVSPLFHRARLSPMSSSQRPQHLYNDSSTALSSYCCPSHCSEIDHILPLPTLYRSSKHCASGDPPASPPLSLATSTRQSAFQGQVPSLWLSKQAPGFMAICRICPGP